MLRCTGTRPAIAINSVILAALLGRCGIDTVVLD